MRLVKQTVVNPSRVDVILAKINRGDFFGRAMQSYTIVLILR